MTNLPPVILSITIYDVEEWLPIVGIAIIVLLIILYLLYSPRTATHWWHHTFDNFEYSPEELYKSVQENVAKREIPNVFYERFQHIEESLLGNWREYLRIERADLAYEICAAPFGTGFYVSCRLLTKKHLFKSLLKKNKFFKALMERKTYYQEDTEVMYKELVHHCLTESLDEMLKSKGRRGLTDTEKQLTDVRNK